MHSKKASTMYLLLTCVSLLLLNPTVSFSQATDIGGQLYLGSCAKCHGREGEGFLKLYPPIRNSHYLKEDVSKLPCIIANGLKGKITIEGQTFNQIMPAIQSLKPDQINEIILYMQHKWNHPVTELSVSKWLEDCDTK